MLCSEADGETAAKLIDFGLVRTISDQCAIGSPRLAADSLAHHIMPVQNSSGRKNRYTFGHFLTRRYTLVYVDRQTSV